MIGKPLLILGSLAGASLVAVGGYIGISALDSQMKEQVDPSSKEKDPVAPSDQDGLSSEDRGNTGDNREEVRRDTDLVGNNLPQGGGDNNETGSPEGALRSDGSESGEDVTQKPETLSPTSPSQGSDTNQERVVSQVAENSTGVSGKPQSPEVAGNPQEQPTQKPQDARDELSGPAGSTAETAPGVKSSATHTDSEGQIKAEVSSDDVTRTVSGTGVVADSTASGTGKETEQVTVSSTPAKGENTVLGTESSDSHNDGDASS